MKKEDNSITFSDIIDFTLKDLNKFYPLEKQALVPLQNEPYIQNYLLVPAMISQANKGVFTGILEDSSVKTSGIGFLSLENGQILYFGQVIKKEGEILMDGQGKIINKKEKWKYSGHFKNGAITGYGIMKTGDKHNYDTYKGNLINRKRDGFGELITSSKKKYFGNWNNDRLVVGKIINEDGVIYDGTFNDDKLNGFGFIIEDGNLVSHGNWRNGKLDATVGFKITNDYFYYGGWRNGKPNGKGIYLDLLYSIIMKGQWTSGSKDGKMAILSDDKLCCEDWDNGSLLKRLYSVKIDDLMFAARKEESKA